MSWRHVPRLVLRGYRRTLTYDDIWDIRPQDTSDVIVKRFLKNWDELLEKAGRLKYGHVCTRLSKI